MPWAIESRPFGASNQGTIDPLKTARPPRIEPKKPVGFGLRSSSTQSAPRFFGLFDEETELDFFGSQTRRRSVFFFRFLIAASGPEDTQTSGGIWKLLMS
jgi:hypothetical protein